MLIKLGYTYEDEGGDTRETSDYFWRCQRFAERKTAKNWLASAKFDSRPEFESKLYEIKDWPARDKRSAFRKEAKLERYKVIFDEDDEPNGTYNLPSMWY